MGLVAMILLIDDEAGEDGFHGDAVDGHEDNSYAISGDKHELHVNKYITMQR